MKLLQNLFELNPNFQGEWANTASRDLLQADPTYDKAVRATERAFLYLSLVNPKANTMFQLQQHKIDAG